MRSVDAGRIRSVLTGRLKDLTSRGTRDPRGRSVLALGGGPGWTRNLPLKESSLGGDVKGNVGFIHLASPSAECLIMAQPSESTVARGVHRKLSLRGGSPAFQALHQVMLAQIDGVGGGWML
jgi:hypothetical protein